MFYPFACSKKELTLKLFWQHYSTTPQDIYQDSKLLAPIDCFVKLVETGFRPVGQRHMTCTLDRLARKVLCVSTKDKQFLRGLIFSVDIMLFFYFFLYFVFFQVQHIHYCWKHYVERLRRNFYIFLSLTEKRIKILALSVLR